jgi:hypothetical protein
VMTVCQNCGHQNEKGVAFCASCGTFLEWSRGKTAPVVETPEVQPASPAPPHRPPAPTRPAVVAPPAPRPPFRPTPDRLSAPCPACGKPVPTARRFCPSCGTEVATFGRPSSPPAAPTRLAASRSLPAFRIPRTVLLAAGALVVVVALVAVVPRLLSAQSSPSPAPATRVPTAGPTKAAVPVATVPEVRNEAVDDARAALETACEPAPCFEVALVSQTDEEVGPNLAIRTEPALGTELPAGSKVTLFVSQGRAEDQPRTAGPLPPGSVIYIVEKGDSLSKIARRFDRTLDEIIDANPQVPNPNQIRPGDEIIIPGR